MTTAENNQIHDALDRIRRPHEPYAKKATTFNSPRLSSNRGLSLKELKELAEKKAKLIKQQEQQEWETVRQELEQKKQQAVIKETVDKIVPVKATTSYGTYDSIVGKDLIKITPKAKDFNNAILETSQPLNHEVFYIFDKDGKTVAKWGGKSVSVTPLGMGDFDYSASLHNHPRLYGSTAAPFSPQDIATYGLKKRDHYVVTESYVFKYNVGNMKKTDRDKFLKELKQFDKELRDNNTIAVQKDNSIYGFFLQSEKSSETRHKKYEELSAKYGFEYSRMTIDDFKKKHKIE